MTKRTFYFFVLVFLGIAFFLGSNESPKTKFGHPNISPENPRNKQEQKPSAISFNVSPFKENDFSNENAEEEKSKNKNKNKNTCNELGSLIFTDDEGLFLIDLIENGQNPFPRGTRGFRVLQKLKNTWSLVLLFHTELYLSSLNEHQIYEIQQARFKVLALIREAIDDSQFDKKNKFYSLLRESNEKAMVKILDKFQRLKYTELLVTKTPIFKENMPDKKREEWMKGLEKSKKQLEELDKQLEKIRENREAFRKQREEWVKREGKK